MTVAMATQVMKVIVKTAIVMTSITRMSTVTSAVAVMTRIANRAVTVTTRNMMATTMTSTVTRIIRTVAGKHAIHGSNRKD